MAVEKLTAHETAVLKAIKSGAKTLEEIAEKSKLAHTVCTLLTGSLSRKNQIRRNPNDKTFSVVDPSKLKDKIVCYGNLLLPFFFRKNATTGERFVVRGTTWNKIEEDTTEDDIIWEDDTKETVSKKSDKEPKSREHLINPVERVVLPSRFQQWSNKAIVRNTIKGNYTGTIGVFKFDLIVGDSRADLTSVEGGVRVKFGTKELPEYPVLKKCLLVDTKALTAYLKGTGVSPFTLSDFLAKPESRTVYFPVSKVKTAKGISTAEALEFTMKVDDPTSLNWRIMEINSGADGFTSKRISSASGSLTDVSKLTGLKPFLEALKGFKLTKA